jgi:hypothetical protein
MAMLAHWNKEHLPPNFFGDHFLWILKDGKVYKRKANGKMHTNVWGSEVWDIEERGYYNQEFGLITCHGEISLDLKRKLARKFKDAMFVRGF